MNCVYDPALTVATLCPLATLPFMAQTTGGALPSVEQVMDRVVVSHDWMGRNFETFLRTHDTAGDFRRMLMSTTAVVIGAQVRPSFYYAVTGAIYFDADNFGSRPRRARHGQRGADRPQQLRHDAAVHDAVALCARERHPVPVLRPAPARHARRRRAARQRAGRFPTSLAHALDFPAGFKLCVAEPGALAVGQHRPARAAAAADFRRGGGELSAHFHRHGGPRPGALFGATATAVQEGYSAAQVAGFFAADVATDDYAYASRREDTAMVLEEFLMQRCLGIKRDFAIAPKPAGGSSLVVQWG
ncbi:MAG: hypothetical protein U1F49_08340 [Rubrivivax sp.]